LFFLLGGLSEKVARMTLISYMPSYRADLTIGLASIILTLLAGAILRQPQEAGERRWRRRMPVIAGGGFALLLVVHSLYLRRLIHIFPTPSLALFLAAYLGIVVYLLLAGRLRQFAVGIAVLQLATTILFNPLSTNLDHLYRSELAA